MRVPWRLSAVLVSGVMTIGLVGTWALVAAVDRQQGAHAAAVMDQRVEVVGSAVSAEVRRYLDMETDLAAAIGAQSDLTAADFTALTVNLNQARLAGVSGVGLVVPAREAEVPRLQRYWRAHGNRGLTLVPAGTAVLHLFSVLNRPLDGTAPATGRDISVAPEPTQAMQVALTRNAVTASVTYVLLSDRDLPTAQQQESFVLAAPILGGLGTPHEGIFQGWLLVGMRGRDFISETMQQASQRAVAVTLIDNSTDVAVPVANVGRGQVVDGTELEREVDLQVAGRRWQLRVQPTTSFVDSLGPSLAMPVGATGAMVTVLLAILVGTLSSSRNRALARVATATEALHEDITRRTEVEAALRETQEELHTLALTDSLTGLSNQRAFMDQLDQAHARAVRHHSQVSVLFCDIDRFKTINDNHGHAAGDAVLQEVATRLRRHFRTEDTVGRLGGDEFAVICENGAAFTEVLLDRVRDALAMPYTVAGKLIAATVSVGIASREEGETTTQMLGRADRTMYEAKAAQHLT